MLNPTTADRVSPVQILAHRLIRKGSKMVEQVHVGWSGEEPSAITWENPHGLRRRFPAAPAWGQAGTQGGENVTPSSPTSSPACVNVQDKVQPRRSTRERQPTSKFSSSEWTR